MKTALLGSVIVAGLVLLVGCGKSITRDEAFVNLLSSKASDAVAAVKVLSKEGPSILPNLRAARSKLWAMKVDALTRDGYPPPPMSAGMERFVQWRNSHRVSDVDDAVERINTVIAAVGGDVHEL